MKVIIAGSRSVNNYHSVLGAIRESGFNISEVVSGGAKGADSLGEKWAGQYNRDLKVFPAKWDEFGKSAGYRRNIEMADYADALIAVWDGESRGTRHMIDTAVDKGLKVHVFRILG